MANPNPTQSFVVSSLATYNVQPVAGDVEDLQTLQHFKTSGLQMLKDAAVKDGLIADFPSKWRHLLRSWVVKKSRAEDLLDRPDYETPTKFFDSLIQRKTTTSEKFDVKLRNFLVSLTVPASTDKHAKTIIDFSRDFFDKFWSEKVLAKLTVDFDDSFTDFVAHRDMKGPLVPLFNTAKAKHLEEAVKSVKKQFVELLHRHFMMALVCADTRLFSFFESNQVPLTANPSDFTDWIQEKILDPQKASIFLTLTRDASPLVITPRARSGFGTIGGGPGSNFPASNNTSPAPQQQTQQQGQQKKKIAQANPSGGGGGSANKAAKTSASSSPNSGGGTRTCAWCKAQNYLRPDGQPSTNWKQHDDGYCYRNPASPKYDRAKAAIPVKN